MNTKTGYVTIIGLPNAGKSTLMNALLGQKLSIMTKKPQTTRKSILGILSEEEYQIIFLDTPGILKPQYALQETMVESIHHSVYDADVLLLLIDIADDPDGKKTLGSPEVMELMEKSLAPKFLVINKTDLANDEQIKTIEDIGLSTNKFSKIFKISALKKNNIESLLNELISSLPEHPKLYPDDIVSMEKERFFVTELIREAIFNQFTAEVPYSTEVIIEEFKEREGRKDYISAYIIVERNTQKQIVIGKKGAAIKEIGQKARSEIEAFLERPVYLELRVKVKDKWRKNELMLKRFGYKMTDE